MSYILGSTLLLLLLLDVFLTVFHAQGNAGPLTRWQNRTVWGLFRHVGVDAEGRPRAAFLGFAAPVMIISTLGLWLALLVGGFALLYLPLMDTFLVSPGQLRAPWVEALYYSGLTASTLGLGDIVPDRPAFRLLTVVQAFGGFALLSVSITYLLAVYRELIAMRATSADIAAWRRARHLQGAERADGGTSEDEVRWAERVSSELSRILQAHFQYPVLHYFRPTEHDHALPLQLTPLVGIPSPRNQRRGDRSTPDPDRPSPRVPPDPERPRPSILQLGDAVEQYLVMVDQVFIPRRFRTGREGGGGDVRRAHRRLLTYMRYPLPGEGG